MAGGQRSGRCDEERGRQTRNTILTPQAGPSAAGWFTHLRAGFSGDDPGLSFEVGTLYRGESWGIGLAVDYNPFISIDRGLEVKNGALNISSNGTRHFQLTQRIALRFEARAGVSVLLFDTPGYDKGTVGLYLGTRVLGFDIRLTDRLFLLLDAIDLSMPIYSMDKVPFYYKQWRAAAGLTWRFFRQRGTRLVSAPGRCRESGAS